MSIEFTTYIRAKKLELIDNCPKCHGYDLSCTCQDAFSLEKRRVIAGIPLRYLTASPNDIEEHQYQSQKTQVLKYTENLKEHLKSGKGAFLWGAEGTAKSLLATYILTEGLKLGADGFFISMGELTTNLIEKRQPGGEDAAKLVNKAESVQILVIDDINFTYRPARAEVAYSDFLIDGVLKKRIDAQLLTIYTSHVSLDDIRTSSTYGNTRLAGMIEATCEQIAFKGKAFQGQSGRKTSHAKKTGQEG